MFETTNYFVFPKLLNFGTNTNFFLNENGILSKVGTKNRVGPKTVVLGKIRSQNPGFFMLTVDL